MPDYCADYNHAEAVRSIRSWFLVTSMAYASLVLVLLSRGKPLVGVGLLTMAFLGIAIFLWRRIRFHCKGTSRITVLDSVLFVPALFFGDTQIIVSKLSSVHHIGKLQNPAGLVLKVQHGTAVVLEKRFFARQEDYFILTALLKEAGQQNLTALEYQTQLQISEQGKSLEVWILLGVIAIWVSLYVLGSAANHYLEISDQFLVLGANTRGALPAHEYYRLVTSFFLHGSILHLLLNTLVLAQLGHTLIQVVGAIRFLTVLLLTSLAATAMSSIYNAYPMSVGGSGGLYGLFAAYIYLKAKFGNYLPAVVNPAPTFWLIGILTVDLYCAVFIFSNIDVVNHVSGFAAGYCWCLLTHPGLKVLQPVKPVEVLLCMVLIALYGYGLVTMLMKVASV